MQIPHEQTEKPCLCWQQVAQRFHDDRDCLASYLIWQAAEVLDGVKPANLVNLGGGPLPCGRNLRTLWEADADRLLDSAGLQAVPMKVSAERCLLLLYRPAALAGVLADPVVAATLLELGYPPSLSVADVLAHLAGRFAASFPHEVGLLLGYPAKDVLAFMGRRPLPYTCAGPWKIYGDAAPSLRLAASHAQSRTRLRGHLHRTESPARLLPGLCGATAAAATGFRAGPG